MFQRGLDIVSRDTRILVDDGVDIQAVLVKSLDRRDRNPGAGHDLFTMIDAPVAGSTTEISIPTFREIYDFRVGFFRDFLEWYSESILS